MDKQITINDSFDSIIELIQKTFPAKAGKALKVYSELVALLNSSSKDKEVRFAASVIFALVTRVGTEVQLHGDNSLSKNKFEGLVSEWEKKIKRILKIKTEQERARNAFN